MALQSHAALAQIRDTLLETYASNDAMNQLIVSDLDPRAWRAQPPGQKGSGRTIAAIFAHLHNSRLVWLKNSAPHLKCPPPLDPDGCTIKQAAAAHRRSSGNKPGLPRARGEWNLPSCVSAPWKPARALIVRVRGLTLLSQRVPCSSRFSKVADWS